MPEKPDVGRPYFRVACKFDALNCFRLRMAVRIYCDGEGAGNRTRRENQTKTWSFAPFTRLAGSSRPSIAYQ
jgi:hypothetical protein